MPRILILFFFLSALTISAQIKPHIFIEGGKGRNCTLGNNWDDLALAIQKAARSAERGTFWLVMAKNPKGEIIASTINIKGKTGKLELSAVEAAEKYKFSSDFDLLMLRVISEVKKAAPARVKRKR